jgi:hypothetical protein
MLETVMVLKFSFGLIVSLFCVGLPEKSVAEITKENIESGTTAYRIVRYTRPDNALSCIAMVCERRDSGRCSVKDGLFSISKRTEEPDVYISYYPADREASRKLRTSIQIGTFEKRSFMPIQDYPETWIVPNVTENEDMLYEMQREDRKGPIELVIQPETFEKKFIRVRDLDSMKKDVMRLCPYRG